MFWNGNYLNSIVGKNQNIVIKKILNQCNSRHMLQILTAISLARKNTGDIIGFEFGAYFKHGLVVVIDGNDNASFDHEALSY